MSCEREVENSSHISDEDYRNTTDFSQRENAPENEYIFKGPGYKFPNNNDNYPTVNSLSDISPPQFDETTGDNPKVFLRDLEEYFKIKRIPSELKMLIVKKCLKKNALDWMRLTLASHASYQTFKNLFFRAILELKPTEQD